MKFKGKFKEDFEKWYKQEYLLEISYGWFLALFGIRTFYKNSLSGQFGVIIDFAEWKGYEIGVFYNLNELNWHVKGIGNPAKYGHGIVIHYKDARIQSIMKFQEIYNQPKHNNQKMTKRKSKATKLSRQ